MTYLKSRKEIGMSLIELLIVILIIGIIAAITIPNLLSSRKAVEQKTAVGLLADLRRAQSSYRDDLNMGTYGTLVKLRSAAPDGEHLIDSRLVDENGNPKQYKGWILSEIITPTKSTFGYKLIPAAGNNADYSFVMYEDGVVRQTAKDGPWERGSGTAVED